jgi:quinol monooxygenase YgiN/mannose-6-phosphate isomerase-like protein (cupin superfamily)
MSKVARYAKATAQPGQGDELAEKMLSAAEQCRAVAGCELYVVNRAAGDPDTIWITEVWSDQQALDDSLAGEETQALIAEVRPLIAGMDLIELDPLGGVGLDVAPAAKPDYTHMPLKDAPDMAAGAGLGDMGEARFVSDELGALDTGVSQQILRPGKRQTFGHRHKRAEEVYVITAGSGRARIDDDVLDVTEGDAIRIAPGLTRAFEAGDDGLELIAFGPRRRGDAEMVQDWWSD